MKRPGLALRALWPVPLAAPETQTLRRQRLTIVAALVLLGLVCQFWNGLMAGLGVVADALVIGILGYLLVAVPLWLITKRHADDIWLFTDRDP